MSRPPLARQVNQRLAASSAAAVPDLVVQGATVRFGGLLALDNVSLEVRPGEVIGIIGPNGAGKTTLFNVICGFVSPAEGAIAWRGEPLERHRPHDLARLGISRTLQGVGLFAGMSVRENVMAGLTTQRKTRFASALFGLPSSDRDERRLALRADEALAAVDCLGFAERMPASLPYPVQKRVALARGLVSDPRMLMLDEPAGGLGADDIEVLAGMVRSLRRRACSVLLVEHHMEFVMEVCDRIVVLDFGKVIATGTATEIQANAAVSEAYLGLEVGKDTGTTGSRGAV